MSRLRLWLLAALRKVTGSPLGRWASCGGGTASRRLGARPLLASLAVTVRPPRTGWPGRRAPGPAREVAN